MTKYFIVGTLLFLGAIWSLFMMLYYGWLTATPVKEGYLPLYQKSAMFWFWTFVTLIGLAVACVVRTVVLHLKQKKKTEQLNQGDGG